MRAFLFETGLYSFSGWKMSTATASCMPSFVRRRDMSHGSSDEHEIWNVFRKKREKKGKGISSSQQVILARLNLRSSLRACSCRNPSSDWTSPILLTLCRELPQKKRGGKVKQPLVVDSVILTYILNNTIDMATNKNMRSSTLNRCQKNFFCLANCRLVVEERGRENERGDGITIPSPIFNSNSILLSTIKIELSRIE